MKKMLALLLGVSLFSCVSCGEEATQEQALPPAWEEERTGEPYEKLVGFLCEEGIENVATGVYEYTAGYSYFSDRSARCRRKMSYAPGERTVALALWIDAEYSLTVRIDEAADGVYAWRYEDKDGRYMAGTLQAATFTADGLLACEDSNVEEGAYDQTLRLASSMADLLCLYLGEDLSAANVTAEELGFLHF